MRNYYHIGSLIILAAALFLPSAAVISHAAEPFASVDPCLLAHPATPAGELMPPPPITVALSAPETPSPRLAQSSESVSAKEALAEKGILHVNYNYQSGQYIRRVRATVNNPWGLWRALLPLQAPLGAKGAYGLIGDDRLLGQSPGFGLIQLGGIARKYITFESVYVVQPAGFRRIGVQKGVFTNVDEMNDVTLGWVFFDLRPKFEADLKQMLDL